MPILKVLGTSKRSFFIIKTLFRIERKPKKSDLMNFQFERIIEDGLSAEQGDHLKVAGKHLKSELFSILIAHQLSNFSFYFLIFNLCFLVPVHDFELFFFLKYK